MTDLSATAAGLRLAAVLGRYERLAIAFSGGVDSTLLAFAAALVLGPEHIRLVHIATPLNKNDETVNGTQWAAAHALPLTVIRFDPRDDERIRKNHPRRCYFCKKKIIETIRAEVAPFGFSAIADGANLDDLGDYRPGLEAAAEAGVLHPLIEAQMTKRDIRELAEALGMPNWNAPAAACLASRFRYGAELTDEALRRVEAAENYLESLGFTGCRVRDLDRRAGLEINPSFFRQILEKRQEITDKLRELGFLAVLLNLEGYRQGTMNDELSAPSLP